MLPKMRIDGAVAELRVTADLMKKGYMTFSPTMDNTECDLVAEVGGRLFKLQIKSAHSDGDKMKVDLVRSSAKNKFYTKDDFDVLAVYDSTTDQVAYLAWATLPHKRCITLRFTEETNSNGFVGKYGRMFFNDFNQFPELSEIGSRSTDANDGGNRQAI
jgi:hypothetical protein